MKGKEWTLAEIQYIKDNYLCVPPTEIARHLGRSLSGVYNTASNLGIKKFKYYSPEESKFVRDNYKKMSYGEIARKLGRSYDSVRRHCKDILGLHRTFNEGKAIQDKYSMATRFKKGNLPHNTRYEGATSIRQKKGDPPYKYIRTSVGVWKLLHRVNFETKFGPIPEGKYLRCIDGNTLNCEPDNWKIITKDENLSMNSGRGELTDKYVLFTLSPNDKALRDKLKKHPELIELKRSQLKLKRTTDEYSN